MFLTRNQILEVNDLEVEEVEVPEWGKGAKVLVQGLSSDTKDKFESGIVSGEVEGRKVNLEQLRAKLVAVSVVDEDGNRLFMDSDIVALGKKSAKAIDRIFSVAQKLSAMTKKDVEELTKNSETTQGEDSSSV